jgi:hypothetical protein
MPSTKHPPPGAPASCRLRRSEPATGCLVSSKAPSPSPQPSPLAVSMQLSVQFPLTLTLSPEERESATLVCEYSLDGEPSPMRRNRLPLLGERVGVRGNSSAQLQRYGLGRGSIVARGSVNRACCEFSTTGHRHSLSLGERAGVRGNRAPVCIDTAKPARCRRSGVGSPKPPGELT